MNGSACGIRTRDLRLERAVSWAARRMRRSAGDGGFEPPHTDPESAVLPLDESAEFYHGAPAARTRSIAREAGRTGVNLRRETIDTAANRDGAIRWISMTS